MFFTKIFHSYNVQRSLVNSPKQSESKSAVLRPLSGSLALMEANSVTKMWVVKIVELLRVPKPSRKMTPWALYATPVSSSV